MIVITRATDTVEVNGKAVFVDLTGLSPDIKQVKWFGANGVIHHIDQDGEEGPTERITSIAAFAGVIAQANQLLQTAELPPPLTLADYRVSAALLIDAEAGRARARFITVTAGQEMTYLEKSAQAAAFIADQNPTPEAYPLIHGEVGITAETATGVAEIIVARHGAWKVIGALIEQERLSAKRDVAAAESAEAIGTIIDDLTWPMPE